MMESDGRLDDGTVVRRSPDLVDAEVDGEVTMMSIETGRYYGLTTVGTRIWNLLERPMRIGELCDRLRDEYRVEPDRCAEEVKDFLDTMIEHGLVERP